jgi:capsid protein
VQQGLQAVEGDHVGQEMMYSSYSGANHSLSRGQVFHPSLETRDEMDAWSHQEMLRKCRWLAKNVGFIKGFVKNAADLIGYLMPQSSCGNEAWAALAEAAFERRTSSANVFDRAGKVNFRKAQLMLTRQALRDGDMLTVLGESSTGGAMFAFYEAHQIRNPKGLKGEEAKKWSAGVKLNGDDRHWKYGLGKDQNDAAEVEANRCIYFGDFESAGNRRAYPPLAHAVNHSIDIVETWANVKSAIKASSLTGFVREREANAPSGKAQEGMPGRLMKSASPSAPGELNVAEVWSSGQIPELPPGVKMKVIHDARPAREQQEFVASLKDECAYGFGVPPEVLMDISKLTSAGVRFVLERAARWIELRQMDLEEWCKRVWVYVLAKEMKAGRLPYPPEGLEWWKVEFVPLRDITIDRGKMKQEMDEVKSGMGTHSAYWRRKGGDWQEAARQKVREEKFHQELCEKEGVEYDRVFPPLPGATLIPAAQKSAD